MKEAVSEEKLESRLAKAYKDGGKSGYQAALNDLLTQKSPGKIKSITHALYSLFL